MAGEAGEEGEMQEGEGEEDALEAAGEGSEDHAAAAVRSPLHGKSELMYEWVIIIGGQPTVKLDDGCTVKEDHTDASGLWLMTRQPQPPSRVIEEMHASLAYHGVSRAQLHPVEHAGCHYVDANLCRDGKCSSYCIKWGCTNGCCKRNAIEDTTVVRNVTHWGVTEGDGFGYEKPPGVQWGPIPVEDCDQCAELCVADDCDEWTCTEDYKRCQFKSQRNASLVRSPKHRRVLATAGYERWSRIE